MNHGSECCAEHDGVLRFSKFVLYVEMRKIRHFRLIAAANTPFIYFSLHKYHITNVYHKFDIAPMQKFLKIH